MFIFSSRNCGQLISSNDNHDDVSYVKESELLFSEVLDTPLRVNEFRTSILVQFIR